ncbi:MAG: hypothetical protein V1787_03045 [Candidatus Micrarchaeota archaeon]
MEETKLHRDIQDALFDVDKLCVTKECIAQLRRYRQMFPTKEARQRSKRSVFFQKFFSDLHQDAMICYLERAKGWPLNHMQEHLARLEVDTQVNIAIAANWNHVIDFYSQWFDRLEQEFDRMYFTPGSAAQQENNRW